MFDLDRFRRAQAQSVDGFNTALGELQAGRKRSHWIWYIFPQLAGLGSSAMADRYALQGVAEAMEYLRDAMLRGRLLALTHALVTQLQRRPAPALDELRDWVSAASARYKAPRELVIVDSLPRAVGGKLRRDRLTIGATVGAGVLPPPWVRA